MSKVAISEQYLTEIADAIRTKTKTTDLYSPDEMGDAILDIPTSTNNPISITSNGTYTAPEGTGYSPVTVNVPQEGAPTPQELTFTGSCSYRFSYGGWDWFINKYGSQIQCTNVQDAGNMFNTCGLNSIPFDIYFNNSSYRIIQNIFNYSNLKTLPYLYNLNTYNLSSWCGSCYYLRNIPDDYFDTWTATYTSGTSTSQMFNYCYSLRKIPESFFKWCDDNITPYSSTSSGFFGLYYLAYSCYTLDELTNVWFNPLWKGTSNYMGNIVNNCYRLKDFTFMTDNGTPRTGLFKTQTFDFSQYNGWANIESNILNYNSGITSAKKVTDATSYNLLKDDPDWYTTNVKYSRYNHDSAVRTINTLPDTHATGTNTIKFKGQAGELTDGGAINTLTDAEIAVAAAKGWTVTFA